MAGLEQRDVARDIAARHAGAHIGTQNDALLPNKADQRNRELRLRRGQAACRRDAAATRDRISGFERPGCARQFDGVIDAATGRLAHALHDVGIGGIECVGRAQFQRQIQLGGIEIDGNDGPCSAGARAEQRRQPDASQTQDRDRLAGLTLQVFITVPTPVITAQPNSAAWISERSASIFTMERRETTAYSEKAQTPQ